MKFWRYEHDNGNYRDNDNDNDISRSLKLINIIIYSSTIGLSY